MFLKSESEKTKDSSKLPFGHFGDLSPDMATKGEWSGTSPVNIFSNIQQIQKKFAMITFYTSGMDMVTKCRQYWLSLLSCFFDAVGQSCMECWFIDITVKERSSNESVKKTSSAK